MGVKKILEEDCRTRDEMRIDLMVEFSRKIVEFKSHLFAEWQLEELEDILGRLEDL